MSPLFLAFCVVCREQHTHATPPARLWAIHPHAGYQHQPLEPLRALCSVPKPSKPTPLGQYPPTNPNSHNPRIFGCGGCRLHLCATQTLCTASHTPCAPRRARKSSDMCLNVFRVPLHRVLGGFVLVFAPGSMFDHFQWRRRHAGAGGGCLSDQNQHAHKNVVPAAAMAFLGVVGTFHTRMSQQQRNGAACSLAHRTVRLFCLLCIVPAMMGGDPKCLGGLGGAHSSSRVWICVYAPFQCLSEMTTALAPGTRYGHRFFTQTLRIHVSSRHVKPTWRSHASASFQRAVHKTQK